MRQRISRRFQLRLLVVAVGIVPLLVLLRLSYVGYQQSRRIAELNRRGCHITTRLLGQDYLSQWIQDTFKDTLVNSIEVQLPDAPPSRDDIALLDQVFSGSFANDRGQPDCWLVVAKYPITDADLRQLAKINNLAGITVDSPLITDAGMTSLADCHSLRQLSLRSEFITDDGLKSISAMHQLEWLELVHSKVTDAGVSQLTKLDKLIYVDLSFTSLSDRGVANFSELPHLEELCLKGTHITDHAAECLSDCSRLASVDLSDTRVTSSWYQKLKISNPKLRIESQ